MLPAIIVGLWTAWYLGIRSGVIAAVAVAGALLVAQFLPGASITVYALVIAWCAALYFVFPRLGQRSPAAANATVAAQVSSAWSWAKKMLQR
jgi:hypothetical protein